MSYKHRCWGGKKKDFLNSWQAELLEFYKFSLFTRKMKQWSRISGMIKTTEAFTSWGWIQYCVCIGINIAWACNMYADGYWTQIRTRPDIQKLLLQFSGRESGWITQTHKYRQLNTHTRACLSSFWAVFQCAISSAERPQICLWNLAFMTTSSVLYSNYRWQHTRKHTRLHAPTHTRRKLSVHTKLNIGV